MNREASFTYMYYESTLYDDLNKSQKLGSRALSCRDIHQ